MLINQVIMFGGGRLNVSINEKERTIHDVTMLNGSEDLGRIMELISHMHIDQAIKYLEAYKDENIYAQEMIDILKCY